MDVLTSQQRRRNMQNIRSKNTLPERIIVRELRKRKFYFTTNVANIPGKPDIVFRRKKIAIFIDSDFWHGHPTRFIAPVSNAEYWDQKIARNKKRDKVVRKILEEDGWRVLRFWEIDIKKNPEKIILKIANKLSSKKN